jgi:hypothetical protein
VIKFQQNWLKQEAIHKFINSVWNKEELPDQWKESIILPVHKKGQEVCEDTADWLEKLKMCCGYLSSWRVTDMLWLSVFKNNKYPINLIISPNPV